MEFENYMDYVREVAELISTEVTYVRKGQIVIQKGGLRV